MPIFALDNTLQFPSPELADTDGLLAMGGDLSVPRLLMAYRMGIFPWFEGSTPLWWSPDPRFVLYPGELRISKSMKQVFKKRSFDFTVNVAFGQVIAHCRQISRNGQSGTWITRDMERAYIELHKMGIAHSAEAWLDGRLVGGCYGIRMGKAYSGESMFSLVSNASKFAFLSYAQLLRDEGVHFIDCQVYTAHLESLGAKDVPREKFLQELNAALSA
jgi:leucyl/phenylalanyl-tRNA--protein transferase